MKTVNFGDLEFTLRRSEKRKTIGITVERDGSLSLAAPPSAPMDAIKRTVDEKRRWIYTKLDEKRELQKNAPPPKEYVPGEGFHYLGRSHRLDIVDGEDGQPPLRLYRGWFQLRRDARDDAREHFINWYTAHLLPRVREKAEDLAPRIGATPKRVSVRDLGNRWGSCGSNVNIAFHWRVALLPPRIIDYLAVHEMVHLVAPRHDTDFWLRVDRVLPDYEERRQWLARHGIEYDI